MSSSNKFYIVSEGKNLNSEEKNEFYEFLSKSDLLGIKFVYPNDLSDLASDIIRSGAERFY